MVRCSALVTAVAVLLMPARLQAQQTGDQDGNGTARRAVTAVRSDAAVTLDGRNAEAFWRAVPPMAEFRQFAPRPASDPTFRTEFQVAHTERELYVFVRAFDPEPDSIMRALTRRDVRGPSDQIIVSIDSYNDRRTAFRFAVNPVGVKRDFAIYNDVQEDGSWNGVWDVATTIDSLGWTAEFRIPLSQLRFARADRHTFGFGVVRDVERFNERVSWPEFVPTRSGIVSQLGRLEGLAGIDAGRPVEFTPYTLTRNEPRALETGGFERVQKLSAGADLKLGLTPNVTLDATVNPDFGQVEADPAVLNLTAFETFLEERRPFFVEGTGFYRFALNCYVVVDCRTNEGLFYSRRIGRAPTLLGAYGNEGTPASTPIAAALKLTGRTAGGLSFGLLDAFTQHVDGAGDRSVEPRGNYAVLRAQQDFRNGEAGVGVIATAVNRALDSWTRNAMHHSAYVTGLSFRNRFGGANYEVAGSITASHVAGSPEALLRTQQSAVHYYQQPGDDVEVDSTRTSLFGHAQHIKFGKYGGGITRFETSLLRQSAGFEPNDLGFLRRADVQDWSTWASLRFQNPRRLYRWAQVNANHWQTWTTSGLRLENAWNFNGHMGLHSNWDVHAGGTVGRNGDVYCDRCTRGGPALRQSRGFFPWFGVNGDNRRMLVPSLWVNLSYTDEGQSQSTSLNPSLTMRFSTRFQVSLGARVAKDHNQTQWFGNYTDSLGLARYSFARLDQRTLSVSTRINYTASPDLTFEFYGEPFVSKGRYSQLRELSGTPEAESYADRFQPFAPPAGSVLAFTSSQLRTNAVLRWEYRPGSTLFLVWAHGRQARMNEQQDQAWHDDYRDLFDLHPENTFLIKVAYWLNR
jgi:hypothetical protein